MEKGKKEKKKVRKLLHLLMSSFFIYGFTRKPYRAIACRCQALQ